MLKDCWQKQNRSQQQQNMSHSNGSVQINATQDRGAYDTTGTVKTTTELRANDNYQDMQETYGEHEPVMVLNIKPLRTMMQNNMTLTEEEIKEIMSLSYENLRQPARADTGICKSEESDVTEDITQEPV